MTGPKSIGRTTCPVCGKRNVAVQKSGKLWTHSRRSVAGAGFDGLEFTCKASNKKLEELT